MSRCLCLISAFLLTSFPALAEEEKTFQETLPRDLISSDDQFLTFTIENDLFGGGTDRHYTNGTRLTYYSKALSTPEFLALFENNLPILAINDTTAVAFSLGQNLYTPEEITTRTPDPNDRPYAGFLYGTVGYTTVLDNHIDEVELTLGVVGPWALAEPTQEIVHEIVQADDPSGWDHQLENEPGLIIAGRRLWPEAMTLETENLLLRTAPHVGASIGNVYTYGAAGVMWQLVPSRHRWQAPPPRVRPAVPGTGFFKVPNGEISWSLFAGVEGRAVARNIFLDGNTFESGPSVDKEIFVTDLSGGFTLSYGPVQTSYTLNWRSKEFEGQADPSVFGAISVGVRF